VENLELYYAFVENANRVFGDDSPQGDHRMASSLLNAGYKIEGIGRLTGYAYLLDYDSVDAFSTNTVGGRFAGQHPLSSVEVLYGAEYAKQSDAGNNPVDVDADYTLGEIGVKLGMWTAKVGAETLGGSGDPGDKFQTPLAALHGFNGWADKFLTTPDTGLEDTYASVGAKIADLDCLLAWHDFKSDSDSMDYGTELDASVTYPLSKKTAIGLKYAAYDADEFATDTMKAWAWITYNP
jgi:hypothetical protein